MGEKTLFITHVQQTKLSFRIYSVKDFWVLHLHTAQHQRLSERKLTLLFPLRAKMCERWTNKRQFKINVIKLDNHSGSTHLPESSTVESLCGSLSQPVRQIKPYSIRNEMYETKKANSLRFPFNNVKPE